MNRTQDSRQTTRLPATVAAVIGVLALACALAAGHFVAAFVAGDASPYLAVGTSAVNLSPGWLKNFAIDMFGTHDKLVLLIGMAVVLVALAVLAGLLSRRSATVGTVLLVVLGLLGLAAVYTSPTTGALALVAPLASVLVGVFVFRLLHRLARQRGTAPDSDRDAPEGQADTMAVSNTGRRRFLIGAGGALLGAGLAGGAGQLLLARNGAAASRAAIGTLRTSHPARPVPSGAAFTNLGTPPFITPNRDFYRVDTVLRVPRVDATEWRLRIHGMVRNELTLDFDDIMAMPLVERTITMVCVSNPVGGEYISTAKFIGVELRDLLRRAGVHSGAEQLFSTSTDGYTAGTPVDVLSEPHRGALLAVGMNGEPLPFEHGFPARMVVPGLYGYMSATKWVEDMELTTWQARTPYWLKRNWARRAPIKTESRIDKPSGFDTVSAGSVPVSGIAWHPHVGIDKVELQLDDGPWHHVELGSEYTVDTWRMWHTTVEAKPGDHRVTVRATDKNGNTQTRERRGTVPDGATGRHSVSFSAE